MMSRQRRESLLYQHRQHHLSHQPCLRSGNHRPSMRLSRLQNSLRYFQWDRAPIGPMIANRSLREHCVVRSQVSRVILLRLRSYWVRQPENASRKGAWHFDSWAHDATNATAGSFIPQRSKRTILKPVLVLLSQGRSCRRDSLCYITGLTTLPIEREDGRAPSLLSRTIPHMFWASAANEPSPSPFPTKSGISFRLFLFIWLQRSQPKNFGLRFLCQFLGWFFFWKRGRTRSWQAMIDLLQHIRFFSKIIAMKSNCFKLFPLGPRWLSQTIMKNVPW